MFRAKAGLLKTVWIHLYQAVTGRQQSQTESFLLWPPLPYGVLSSNECKSNTYPEDGSHAQQYDSDVCENKDVCFVYKRSPEIICNDETTMKELEFEANSHRGECGKLSHFLVMLSSKQGEMTHSKNESTHL